MTLLSANAPMFMGYSDPSESPADALYDATLAIDSISFLLSCLNADADLDRETREGLSIILKTATRQVRICANYCERPQRDDPPLPGMPDYPHFSRAAAATA